jgi:enoyl-CoA hydratase/carnithine racemase
MQLVTIEKRGPSPWSALTGREPQCLQRAARARAHPRGTLEIQAVVLAGAPNAFSAGFDLKATDGRTVEKALEMA